MAPRNDRRSRRSGGILAAPGGEAGAGIVLLAAAVAGMLAANSAWSEGYRALFAAPLPWTPVAGLATLGLWINDGLMAVFFFVIGLEIKREVLGGELSSPRKRRLPVIAGLAGMAVPAFVSLAVARGHPGLERGWAVPAATDIAFALGALALLGSRVPPALRLFLLTVAVVGDLGAVAIIALFHSGWPDPFWMLASGAVFAAMMTINRLRISLPLLYIVGAAGLWYCVLHSGLHATIGGVLAALAVPLAPTQKRGSLLLRMEHALMPWNAWLIVPLFGFANAGVALHGNTIAVLAQPLPLAIATGLTLGKPLGIFAAIVALSATGLARRPEGASYLQLLGLSVLCGTGFTMSLFIGAMAFAGRPALHEEAKLGILLGSVVSALAGLALLGLAPGPRPRRLPPPDPPA